MSTLLTYSFHCSIHKYVIMYVGNIYNTCIYKHIPKDFVFDKNHLALAINFRWQLN